MSLAPALAALAAAAPTDPATLLNKPHTSPYGYLPDLGASIAFLVLFSIMTIVHLGLAVRYRYWTAIASMGCGGILEIIGWAGRVWSWKNVLLWDNFIMQTVCTIIAPVFFSGWIYILLAIAIRRLGGEYSLIGHELYVIIFIIADIVSIVVQAVGGGAAATDARKYESTTTNTHVMLAGILFQVGMMGIFTILGVDFTIRVYTDHPYPRWWKQMFRKFWPKRWFARERAVVAPDGHEIAGSLDGSVGSLTSPDSGSSGSSGASPRSSGSGRAGLIAVHRDANEKQPRVYGPHRPLTHPLSHPLSPRPGPTQEQTEHRHCIRNSPEWGQRLRDTTWLLAGVALATLMIFMRGIYRAVELAEGWDGYVMLQERLFWWLDGFPMLLLMVALAVSHPGFWLPRRTWAGALAGRRLAVITAEDDSVEEMVPV